MVAAANLVEVAALVGDTARATMLNALMGGQSLTATELAYCANVSRATASGHLSKLVAARLLTVTRNRRFSYYRIASPLVATMLESIKVVAAIEVPPRRQPRSASDEALRFARSCYDHLAGQVGVAVTDALAAMGHIVLTDEGGEVTSSGERFLSEFGVDLKPRTRRMFCQPCLDWSERRYHLKGLRGSDSGSPIGARMVQMYVEQPRTPANFVWKGGLVRNLPDRDQQRGCAKPSTIRRGTANSLSGAKRNLLQVLQVTVSTFRRFWPSCLRFAQSGAAPCGV
jgi:DNA-binding transcriptional ArsR family regulator